MCDMTMVAVGAQGVSTIMKARAEEQAGERQKGAHFLTGAEAERAAADAVERGKIHDLQTAMKGSAVEAEQKVIQSGSGADMSVGAPLATRLATGAITDVDRAIVRRNAALQAYGLRGHARAEYQQGFYAEAAGKAAAAGTFLSGVIGMGGKIGERLVDVKEPTASEETREEADLSTGDFPMSGGESAAA